MNRSLVKRLLVSLGGVIFFVLASPAALRADTITMQIGSYIDGRDLLYIQGNTLKWQTINATPVGMPRSDVKDTRTTISIWLNGVLEQSTKWQPTYPSGSTSGAFTDAFTFFPALPVPGNGIINDVSLAVNSGRGVLGIYQLPSLANGETLILEFKDVAGGAAWYQGTLTISYETPEPASLFLIGTGMLGLAVVVRRKFAHP